ncbi:MAG: PSD1 domain-containing protein [Saprospiraceae bacterium]|nr:PSD1 domain-containing protein [Saprospiraceae bacterium]
MVLFSKRWIWLLVLIAGGTVWLANLRSGTGEMHQEVPKVVDFNWHIRPILSDRCFACHGPDEKKREANLRLDTREGAFAPVDTLQGIPRFAIVAGHPEQSLLIHRIHSSHPDSIMPPRATHLTLNEYEKKLLWKWIEQGAQWKDHWAFIAPQRPIPPKVSDKLWNKNPIDAFVFDKMAEHGLSANESSDPERLIRRASMVLTGLPPTPGLVEKITKNTTEQTYNELIDTLLESAAYGERWAMYWMDLSRYSDTHGYQDDLPRIMWPWRDWVIKAFNENMPYNQFVTWQLAGDLLPDKTKETLLASGFNRNHKISQEGGVIDEEYRVEYVADRTNTFGKAFLGLTNECARCHDHKYDPLTTRDYYGMFAFFNQVDENGFVPNLQTPKPYMIISPADLTTELPFLNGKAGFKTPKDTILQMIMRDSVGLRKSYVLVRGQYDQHGQEVQPNMPAAVLPFDTTKYSKNRIGMAQWLFDPSNPLTARVWVNRLWQEVYGRGIVATPDNFGMQGALPSHPELLDWLAVEFRESGWNMKHLLKLMVTSAAFKQSSVVTKDKLEKDPENIWLSRGPRFRLPYEFIRDNILASSGLLHHEIGGPSVKPWQPAGIWEEISTEKTANAFRGEYSYIPDTLPEKQYRRSLYTYQRRTIPPPTHLTFDAPTRDNCEVRRTRSNTPLQALVMLNDRQVLTAARKLAFQIVQGTNDPASRISAAFQRILTRTPTKQEMKPIIAYYQTELERLKSDPKSVTQLLETEGSPDQAALMLAISLLYNLDEALVL